MNLFIEELKTETIISELKNDHLDGAILATPLGESGMKEHPLYYEPLCLYLSGNHPLLKKKFITPKDLDESQMWFLQDGHCFKNQVANFCSFDGASVLKNIHFQSGNMETLKNIVKKAQGYTMLPQLMIETMNKTEVQSHVRYFTSPIPTREISFIYRRDHWKLEIISALEEIIKKYLPESVSSKKDKRFQVLEIC